jgi:hypothetical protein
MTRSGEDAVTVERSRPVTTVRVGVRVGVQ